MESDVKENLELYEYASSAWSDNYKAGDEDMRYVNGDPWDPEERKAREEASRPCLCFDELGQYINQRINDIRQNKRGVKIDPKGNGANDKTAALREDIIRTIESKGGTYAYIIGYENALQRGMGFWAVGKRYQAWDAPDQELYIRCIPNTRSAVIDPDVKEAAGADMRFAFLLDSMSKKAFIKAFGKNAKQTSFAPEMISQAPSWFREDNVQVAECWKLSTSPVTVYLVGDQQRSQKIYSDKMPAGAEIANGGLSIAGQVLPIIWEHKTERKKVIQQIMSGVETLDEDTPWEGRWIPIIPVFGRQYWMEEAGGSKRIVESLIRKSRDGQTLHNYVKTAQHEAIGRILKSSYMAYDSVVAKYQKEWAVGNKVPLPFFPLDATATGPNGELLPPPIPMMHSEMNNISAYEMADEGIKRSIQASLGMYSSNQVKADASGKSGKAQLVQQEQSDQGNYHFTSSLDQSIEHTGRILDEMIPHVYDTERELLLRTPDEKAKSVTINAGAYKNDKGELVEYRTDIGDHEATVSVGPGYQSQREAADKLGDLLLESPFAPRVADLVIKNRNLGPLGDQMAERLTPPEFSDKGAEDPNAMKQKLAQAAQMIQVMTQQLESMTEATNSKKMELESKEKIAAMQADVDKLKIQADMLKAHEQLTSNENQAVFQANIQQSMAEVQARIDALAAEHGAELQQRQVQVQGAQEQEVTP
jgi:hypothetical protein